jgi:UbiD family decarboxylase
MEGRGELVRFKELLSPCFEISAALKRFDGRKAILFENVKGFDNKVIGGVYGTRARILEALDVVADRLHSRLSEAVMNPIPCKIGDGPVKEVVDEPKLSEFPILTHFKGDAGPYITSGIVYIRSPDGGSENVSFHRLQILDDKRMAVRVVPRHMYRIKQIAEEMGEKSVDVSISMGLHPVLMFAASMPVPFGKSEFDVANNLLKGRLRLAKCEHVDAVAPADAELVLEGRLLLDEEVLEGPFVDLSGTFDVVRKQPVIELVGAMRREDYLYYALLPSGSEHRILMGMPRETRIWSYVRNVVPTVKGVNMTLGGMGWLHCVVSFEKFREGDPKNVLMAIFAAHPSLKHAVVVDSDIDPYDMGQVEWALATRFRGDEGLLIIPKVRVSSLDPTSDQEKEIGCKVGFDATKPLGEERGFRKADVPISDYVKKILEKYTLKFS